MKTAELRASIGTASGGIRSWTCFEITTRVGARYPPLRERHQSSHRTSFVVLIRTGWALAGGGAAELLHATASKLLDAAMSIYFSADLHARGESSGRERCTMGGEDDQR